MEKECDGFRTTGCCGGTFKLGDTCSICGKFADNDCANCDADDIETCPWRDNDYDKA